MGRYLPLLIMFNSWPGPVYGQGRADEIAWGFWAFWLLWNPVADRRVCFDCFLAGLGVKPRHFPSLATRPCSRTRASAKLGTPKNCAAYSWGDCVG